MMKITRAANGKVVFALIGRMEAENIGEIETLIREEEGGRSIVFDLKDLTLVDQDVVLFFRRCEAGSIKLENCAGYIREWMKQEKS
jgi:hypothetical protein